MFVGNLPLCWPLFRMAFGIKETTHDASYQYRNQSRSLRRKPQHKHMLSSSNGTSWDRLDDPEDPPDIETKRSGSHGGSQIELVPQAHVMSNQHTAGVSSDHHRTQSQHHTRIVGSSSGSPPRTNREKIMVVTTVDISSS